jgi:hypothetical protein
VRSAAYSLSANLANIQRLLEHARHFAFRLITSSYHCPCMKCTYGDLSTGVHPHVKGSIRSRFSLAAYSVSPYIKSRRIFSLVIYLVSSYIQSRRIIVLLEAESTSKLMGEVVVFDRVVRCLSDTMYCYSGSPCSLDQDRCRSAQEGSACSSREEREAVERVC